MNVNSPLLEVKDLHVSINETEILKNLIFQLIKVKSMQLWVRMGLEKVRSRKF